MLIQDGGSKPFVVSLMSLLADQFPYIIFKMGGFVDRDIRGKPGVKSLHASGRAIDIYLSVWSAQEKLLGKQLFAMFKDNAALANTGHVIYDGLVWAAGSMTDETTQKAGVRDIHDDHVHVDFTTTGIMGSATGLLPAVQRARSLVELRYGEWLKGYYGPAFNPMSNNTRLSSPQRQAIYHLNKGTMSMSLDPSYLRAVDQAAKWRAAGKLPPVANASA